MKTLLFADDLAGNSLGRAYCLWELARASGWAVDVVAPSWSGKIWTPLADTAFANDCRTVDFTKPTREWNLPEVDLIVAVKPRRDSFLQALEWADFAKKPIILDIDDADLESKLSLTKPLVRLAKSILDPTSMSINRHMLKLSLDPTLTKTVSNPHLKQHFGGTLLPHVRNDLGPGDAHSRSSRVSVAFIGTNMAHKGIDELRRAVSQLNLAGHTFELMITDAPPPSPLPWERWLGHTSFEVGMKLVASSDIVAIPSHSTTFSRGQLPAKLIDAMMYGRAIVASDTPPVRWAMSDAGLYCQGEKPSSIAAALRALVDPSRRDFLGARARQIALEKFTVRANIRVWERVSSEALKAPLRDRPSGFNLATRPRS